ncbi:MAG: HDOD domain-containing protein [Gammaproteobacteria bacterium]|nr:HDOD domain-containing protein [Gammaproteobacteria bacterium]
MSEIQQRLEEVTGLISLPEVYLKVRRLMDDPNSDIYDFAEVISVDPNLSTRVLRVVNSAYFGFPEPVDSIARAVNMIGIGQLHNMVLGISAISSLALPNDILPLNTFWRASLFSGVLARLLGEQIKLSKSDHLFIAGLLHEIGHLVLYSKFPLQALAAQKIAEGQGRAIHEAELSILGYHYGDIGAMLMANWNLSENLQSITRNQPTPGLAEDNKTEATLMHLAHACAQSILENRGAADNLIDAEVLEMTGLSQAELEDSMDEARSISADMEKVILA